ncbi:piggybac transposable element-derived protein [Anaeramoeba flamelloides]|uniref:Piggybac transposable element-derived protein n=1 Tax=Anaeramoeba flamelloides TaxID=1746091 RepID=A0ABQ8XGJ1_9EUKA|nr:piggybac transposable element-derived protein [Anaeramoeba flamelloides]
MNLHILTQKLNLDIEKTPQTKTRTLRKRNFQNFENFNLRGFSHESESESEESDSDYDPETLTKKKQFKRTVSKKPQSLEKNLKKKKKRLKIKNKNKSTLTLVRKRKTPNKKNKKKLNLTQWSEIGNHVNFSENDHQVSYGHPQEITENQISVLESFKLLMNSELTNKIVKLLNLELKKINETATNRHRLKIKKITDNDFFKFLSYEILDIMKKNCQKAWRLGSQFVVDESMIPFKGRCAFRVRMPRKPANMGIKAWTVTDNCNYVYTWDIFKGVSEKSKDTLLRMTKMAKLDDVEDFYHKVYADSYFGSLEAAEELVEIGVSFNLCVKNDRPSDLFKNNLHQDLRNGEWKSLLKSINGHKLLACTYRDKHKSSTKNVNIITDSINNLEIVKGEKIKPKNIEDYSQNMQYVDRADQNVSSFLFPHKTFSWKKAVLFYYFKVLIHNSKIIFEKKNQQKITLINFISPLCDQLAGKRTIIGHIEHKIIRRQPKRDCSFCRNKFNKSSSTTIKCSGCDCYLHKRCFDYIHYIFK